jgi:hypothetical protein
VDGGDCEVGAVREAGDFVAAGVDDKGGVDGGGCVVGLAVSLGVGQSVLGLGSWEYMYHWRRSF